MVASARPTWAATLPAGAWVVGRDWTPTDFPQTAALLEPYANSDATGLPFCTARSLNAKEARYDAVGLQVELHAIGDKAVALLFTVCRSHAPSDANCMVLPASSVALNTLLTNVVC